MRAQSVVNYSFSSSTGTFTQVNDLTATRLNSVEADSYISPAQSIGFNFVYEGVTYTQFAMSSNGFISLNPTASSVLTANNFSTANASSRPIIAPLWDDLDGNATGSISRAQYELTGTQPNRVLTVEWRNWEWNYGSSNPVMSFQVKLYETTNVIEFVYRQETGSVNSGSASIGIGSATGSGSGSYLNVTSVTTPAVSSTSSVTSINTKPANNQVFTFTPPPPCSGAPAVGQTTASVTTVCTGSSFTLGVTGLPVQSGYSYQFESSPAGANTFTSLGASQTSPSYTVTSQTAATDYRVIVTCTNVSQSTAATLVSVAQTSYLSCYCTPASTCTNEGIENVTFNTTLNNTSTFCTNTSGYTSYTNLGSLTTVTQGQIVPISVTGHINSNPASAGVWIDYNHSGIFEASEYTSLGSSSGISPLPSTYVYSGNVNIDMNALTGITRMRIRQANQGGITAASACTNSGIYGEYEDYLITINAGTLCSGTPTAGTITAPANVCPSIPFSMTPTGYTSGVIGVSYLWEMYNTATSTWGPAPGTNNTLTYTSTGITAPTDFRFVITCANGNGTSTSPAVTVGLTPFMQCYCTPSGSSSSYGVNNFSTTGAVTNISNLASGYSTGGYGNFTGQTLSVTPSSVINFSANYLGTGTYGFAIYIDYNQNGLFSDPGETVFNTTAYATSASGSFTIPATGTTGSTRMRIIANYSNSTPTGQYCSTGINGEFEDYTLNVITLTGCNGIPLPGTAYGPAGVCSGTTFTLNDTAATIGTGISYQWEYSPAGLGSWQPLAGATAVNYTVTGGITTATDYRLSVTCANGGGNDVSNTVSVSINSIFQCYCIPTYASGGTNDYITNVQLGTLVNNTSASGNSFPYYHDYTTQQPATLAVPDIAQGVSYNLSVSFGSDGTQYSRVWIDFNQDGAFSASESFSNLTNAGANGTATISIQVPATALLGNTRMRIRGAEDSQPTDLQACGASGSNYGEAEDYLVNITAPPTCLPPSGPNVTNITTSGADINWTASTSTPSGGYDYYYNTSSTAPTVTTTPSGSVAAGTTSVTLSSLNGSSTYYYWVRANCGNGDFSSWTGGSFMTLLANDLPAGAITLTVNNACSGATYTNVSGSLSTNEPRISCKGSQTAGAIVWFKFVAPLSGFVRVSTDVSGNGLTDTRLGLFTTSNPTDPTDLSSFSIIACDDDNGSTVPNSSTLYATGLTPGNTYYVGVDHWDGSSTGTFCVVVSDVTSSMLASSGSCTSGQGVAGMLAAYTGWLSLTDNSGNLIANVKPNTTTNTTNAFGSSVTVNTGAIRTDGTTSYLDRNYLVTGAGVTSADLQLFFKDVELTTLGVTLANLNVTKQTGTTCVANYNGALGGGSYLAQTGNGTFNGVSWITVTTPGFSNFYLHGGTSPLLINLKGITAANFGNRNRIDWTTGSEMRGDYFELERSADGNNYTRISSVNAKGEASSYTYWDESPLNGLNHYRLKMYAASGQYTYSDVVTANFKGHAGFSVEAYPNPVTDIVNVTINGSLNSNGSLSVMDISGKVIMSVPVKDNTVQVDMTGLANGIYMIRYSDDAHSKTIKLTKK